MVKNHKQAGNVRSSLVRKILSTILLTVLAVAVVCAGIVVYVRAVMDGDRAARFVVPRVERVLHKRISYTSARLSWLSPTTARIILTGLTIRANAESPVLFRSPATVFEVSLASLWRGILAVRRAQFSSPELIIPSRLKTEGPRKSPRRPDSRSLILWPVFELVEIEDGRMLLAEATGRHRSGRVLFSNIRVVAKQVSPAGAGSLAIEGSTFGAGKTGSFTVSGQLPGMPLYGTGRKGRLQIRAVDVPIDSVAILASCRAHEVPLSGGSLNLDILVSTDSRGSKAEGQVTLSHFVMSPKDVFVRKIEMENASARFLIERRENSIHVDVSEARLPGLSVSGEAQVGRISSGDPTLTIAVRNADLDLHRVWPIIPLNLIGKEDRKRLVKAGLKGRVHITGGAWTGKVSDVARGFNLQGTLVLDAVLDRVSGFVPGFALPVTDASGRIRLSADEVLFQGISLTLGKSPIVLNGWITELKKSPRTDLFIAMNAQAQDLPPILENKTVASYLGPWIGKIVDPAGGVSVTLDVKGSLSRPSMKGKIVLKDFQCGLEGLVLPLRKINGSVRFRQSGITVSQIEGIIGSSPVALKGNVVPERIDMSCDLKLSPDDLKRLGLIPVQLEVSRRIPLAISLKGKLPALRFSATLDLKGNGLRLGSIIRKRPGVSLTIEASGTRQSDEISVEEAYMIVGGSRIAARASISSGEGMAISIHLPPKGIRSEALIPIFAPSLEVQPGGRVEGDLRIKSGRSSEPDVDANFVFSHISLRFPGFHKRTEGMNATLRQKGRTFHLVVERARIGSSTFSGAMTATRWAQPKVDIALDFSFLDTSDFTAPPGYVTNVTWGEWIRSNPAIRFLARSEGKGLVTVVKGKAPDRPFSGFKANVLAKDGLLKVPSWQAKMADGIIRGTAVFDIRKETQIPLTLDFHADQLRMERVMTSDPEWLRVEGDLVIDGKLRWKLTSAKANHGIYKSGNIEVQIHDGKINRFDILSKLFSLINLGSIVRGRLPDIIGQGLPFRSLTWDMEVFDTKWKFTNMRLLSDAARINSSGMYFSDQDRIDFRVEVSPLVGFDTIFSGLFGNLLTKDGKILTTTFRVRGLSRSPDVRLDLHLEPFENFKSGR